MRIPIKGKMFFTVVFLMLCGLGKAKTIFQLFDKAAFYNVMASGDLNEINHELAILNDAITSGKEGYEGALLMKKANIIPKAKEKLKFFKEGRIKLETALLANNENVEYHFLRLAIQEHAPKIVKYHTDIEKDKSLVQKHFKSLSPVVQHAILDYCKNSKILHPEDF